MKGNQGMIVSGAILAVLALAFYMLILSPKRSEVSDLDSEITSLKSSIAEQDQVIAFGEQARKEFPRDYGRLVVLGKAVPEQSDTASLMIELNSIAARNRVEFRGISLSEGASGEGTTTTAPAPAPTTPPAEGAPAPAEGESATTPAATTTPAPATEAAAANLPIGAVVGPAGLPTLPYDITLRGGFFNFADYLGDIDRLVQFDNQNGNVKVDGRLMTVDGFILAGSQPGSNPILGGSLLLTSFTTPSEQGTTAGATPGGPAPGGVPQTTPASATTTP